MQRVVSVFLPTWPIDRLRLPVEPSPRPLILAGARNGRRVVTAAAPSALRRGIRIGMPVGQAQAMVPDLDMRPADPRGDRAALERLATWCVRYAPVAAADPPDGVVIDTTGASHLQGGEAALVEDLARRLRRAGLEARIALAGTWGAAWAVARFGASGAIVPDSRLDAALTDLPVAALRIGDDVRTLLHRLGLERIGDLLALPRASIALRVGEALLRRLDQAFGRGDDPIAPIVPPTTPHARLTFAEPIGHEAGLALAVDRLASGLCRQLERRGAGARRLDLICIRTDGRIHAIRAGAALATRDPRHVARLFRERLEAVDAGVGGVETVTLSASLTETLTASQDRLGREGPKPADLGAMVDRIAGRIGAGRIYRLAPVESDIPERSQRRIAPLARAGGSTWPSRLERPERIFDPPQPVDAMALLPDHPPIRFVWRGRQHRVAHADGPERVFGEWWRSAEELASVRDYFRVEDQDGRRFWLFRTGDGLDPATGDMRWYLQGVFG
ncbi:DUF6504 family protein [Marinivivus vitaminiproducens]|uniref:DUF6504 family protein n=1 Tax=Marinivivus vitaminiproducens TaxID=3035935 RepID=UPI0027A7D657|nr:DUF6504 family protein [Geminicoccaceae bacterium SCSIO 64248]